MGNAVPKNRFGIGIEQAAAPDDCERFLCQRRIGCAALVPGAASGRKARFGGIFIRAAEDIVRTGIARQRLENGNRRRLDSASELTLAERLKHRGQGEQKCK